jgi:hypothetical protein
MKFFDTRETRDPRGARARAAEPPAAQIAHAKRAAPYFARLLAGRRAGGIGDQSRGARALPVTASTT